MFEPLHQSDVEAASPAQHSHFWLIVIQTPNTPTSPGYYVGTTYGTLTPSPGATRFDLFSMARAYAEAKDPRLRGGVVLAFDIQPNQIPEAQ